MSQIALNAALSAMQITLKRLESIANDIANQGTTGYKAREIRSTDLMYTSVQTGEQESEINPMQAQIGHGSRVSGIVRMLSQGAMKQTNSPLDLMINGSGYFAVTLADGRKAYTRDGSFSINQQKLLVTKSGEKVDGDLEISGDLQKLNVDTKGKFTWGDDEGGQSIKVFTFPNEQGLEAISNNMFVETSASGAAEEKTPGEDGAGQIQQKALEASNVDAAKAMSELMDANTVYNLAIRIIESIGRIESKSADIIRI